jgi:hypothetical protein
MRRPQSVSELLTRHESPDRPPNKGIAGKSVPQRLIIGNPEQCRSRETHHRLPESVWDVMYGILMQMSKP